MKTMKPLQLQDIINLEYLFHQDKDSSPADLHKRDREFTASLPQQEEKSSNTSLIRSWLSFRIGQEFSALEQRSPGEIFSDIFRLVTLMITLSGIILGAVSGLAFFSYSGTTPVNVFQFLLLFIAPQLFLIVLLLFSQTAAKLLPALSFPSFYTLLFQRVYKLLAARFHRFQHREISAAQRDSTHHALGIVTVYGFRYGRLFYWPFFCLFQGFGLAFNLALLAVSLLKITTSDLAFGWQSTIQFSDAAIHQLTEILALPWSWIDTGAHLLPTITEIAGSRIILKDGIYHLTTTNLTSWWPFLIMCLLVYGVFTRLTLLIFGWFMERRAKAALSFDTPQYKALLRRMTTPMVATQARKGQEKKPANTSANETVDNTTSSTPITPAKQSCAGAACSPSPYTVLVAIDIYEQFSEQQELTAALDQFGFQAEEILPFLADYTKDQQLLSRFMSKQNEYTNGKDILLLLEGWMVPLVSLLSYIKEIRLRIPANTAITIALIGQPQEMLFTPIAKKDFTIWQQKIETLADPYLHLISLAGIDE